MKVQVRSLAPTPPNNSLGHSSSQAIFHLPSESNEGGRDPQSRNLPIIFFATNAIKICHSGGGETNILIQLDGIPTQFLITIGLIEQSLIEDPRMFTSHIREEIIDKLANFLNVYSSNPTLKELTFHLMAKLIRYNHYNCNLPVGVEVEHILSNAVSEMKLLFSNSEMNEKKTVSTYLQSLFELSSAWIQVYPNVAKECEILNESFSTIPNAVLQALKSCIENCPISPKIFSTLISNKLTPVSHSRVLVLQGIPKHLKVDFVKRIIQKTLAKFGGIFMEEIFIPSFDLMNDSKSIGQNNSGCAVVEIRAGRKLDEAKTGLEMIDEFHQHGELDVADNAGTMVDLTVSKVDENLDCCQESCKDIWSMFVRSKLVVDDEKKRLNENCVQLLRKLFERSFNDSVIQFEKVLIENDGNLVGTFLKNVLKPEEIDDNILRKIIAPKECQTLVSLLF
jgi:hypothetical protein